MIRSLPSGIQRLIVAASLDKAVEASVLRDPEQAAKDLRIELSESESAILSAVPAQQLSIMIESMAGPSGIPRRDFLQGSAAAVAAVAAAALGVDAHASPSPSAQDIPITKGIGIDRPEQTRGISIDRPEYPWEGLSLETALVEARETGRPLLVLFIHSWSFKLNHLPTPGEANAERVCLMYGLELRGEILKNGLLTVRVADEKVAEGYKVTVFPAILFLSDRGKELGRVEQPETESAVTQALRKAMEAYRKPPR